jgi:mannitol-1-phosphate 5-dehydrogenase
LKSIVIFGAGKIGRSFLGQVFSNSGYQVVFTDIDQFLVNELNYQKEYNVIIKGEEDKLIPVFNVRAILLSDEETLMDELDNTDIAAVCVGQKGLPGVVKILARSLERRQHRKPGSSLDLIIAENMRDSDVFIREELRKILPENFPIDKKIGLIETSIGKMVPLMSIEKTNQNSLAVFAEEYNTLILSRKNFLNPIPEIPQLAPKDNIKAWVDRKLFIHNFGHAALAYLCAQKNPDYIYTWEALADPILYRDVYDSMIQSGSILISMHPNEFSKNDLEIHISDLLRRFANKSLGDTIYRVGCDLSRKLGPEDRIVPLIKYAFKANISYLRILNVLIAGILFPAVDINGRMNESDRQFINRFNHNFEKIMKEHCRFDSVAEKPVFNTAARIYSDFRKK